MSRSQLVSTLLFALFSGGSPAQPVDAFPEEPRQSAILIPGTGQIHFEITTSSKEAQQFFNQGIALVHGAWSYEADRSFRQCLALDESCAMAWWGRAVANRSNPSRAIWAAWEAFRRRKQSSPREQQFIEAWARYLGAESEPETVIVDAESGRRRAVPKPTTLAGQRRLRQDLEAIGRTFPEDVEARAFLLRHDFLHRGTDGNGSARRPLPQLPPDHPGHRRMASRRGDVRARPAGPIAPGIARMWFADGLGWQKHHRHDAAAQAFETATRVDNRWLAQANAQPYEIPNIVRNAEARCQSLTNAGRFAEAAAVSKELISLPRNPRWPNQSAERGRRCLLATLATAEQWEAIIALDGGPWLRDTDPIARADRAFAMGRAYAWTGNLKAARTLARQLDTTSREFRWLANVIALSSGDLTALQRLREEGYPATLLLHAALRVEAIQRADETLDDAPITATTQAARVEIAWARGMNTDAKKAFDLLRQRFHKCDLSAAPFRRLEEIAKALDYPTDWRLPTQGDGLSALGPPRWTPGQAPDFLLTRGDGKSVKLSDHLGRPVLLVFFLGFGCIHCVEQLQGLHPMAKAFKVAGIDIVTIGTDTVQEVRASIQAAVETDTPAIPFPVLCDPKGTVFKTWRCWDDFEDQPLHGTFLIDRQGRIRWSDISVEPFMQPGLLLRECKRLLAVTSR